VLWTVSAYCDPLHRMIPISQTGLVPTATSQEVVAAFPACDAVLNSQHMADNKPALEPAIALTVSGMAYFSFNTRGPQTRCDGNPEGPSCNDRGRSNEGSGWLVTRRCPSGGHALLGVSDGLYGGLRDYIWNSSHVRTLSDYPRQPPRDLCGRRAHHAISPPTTSLLRQADDLSPVHSASQPLLRDLRCVEQGPLLFSQLRALNSKPPF
jgi:hypothetical protein